MTVLVGPVLDAKARGWPATLGGIAGLALLANLASTWLASRTYFAGAEARVPVIALVPVAASALVGATLGSRDVELDRSTPYPWPSKRLVDVVTWTVLTCAVLGATVTANPHTFGSWAITRNVVGYVGLACLATTTIGSALSWLPGFLLAGTLYIAAPRTPTGTAQLYAWPMTPGHLDWSIATPILLFLAGLISYAHFGPRSTP